jgi:hypothetical protein
MPFDTTQLRTTTGMLLQILVPTLGRNCSTENVNGDYDDKVRGRSADIPIVSVFDSAGHT